MHLNGWATKPDTARAVQLFDVASKAGNLLAGYNLAMLHLRGLTGDRDPCAAAAALLKRVAERGFTTLQVGECAGCVHVDGCVGGGWAGGWGWEGPSRQPFHASAGQLLPCFSFCSIPFPSCVSEQEANEDFQAGEYEWALANYLKAAEMGMELGQSNAAWMLSEGYVYEGGCWCWFTP